MPEWLTACLLLAAGGGAGTIARFFTGRAVRELQTARWPELEFPLGTLLINLAGSVLLGVLAVLCLERRQCYLLLGTGFCGGFTTFSTFSLETYELLRDGKLGFALIYAAASVVAGVFGVWCAMKLLGSPASG
ncbi:MAG: fluoride efflux transporter CrcB [Gemmataceae bacterium]